jgi:hypothetical protein
MSLSSFRQQVAAQIAAAVSVTTVVDGRVEGPVAERDLVCSWPVAVREADGQADEEELEIWVRVCKQALQQHDPAVPLDPGPLETIVEQIQTGLVAGQTSSGPWFLRPVELLVDLDARTVTCRVIGRQYNLFTSS